MCLERERGDELETRCLLFLIDWLIDVIDSCYDGDFDGTSNSISAQ